MATYDTKAQAVEAVWQSFRDTAEALVRQCPHCGQWFRRENRMKYCTPTCTQQACWDRFKDHRVRDYAAEYIARRFKAMQ